MSSPTSPALQQLHCLDGSSPGFDDQLGNILYGEEYRRCAQDLQGDDLVWLVDYLDKALGGLDPSCAAFRKCLRELKTICGTEAILPTSYTILPHLLNLGAEPFASGGYGDVFEGFHNGSRVCIKRVRTYTSEGPKKAAKTFCQEAVMWKYLTHPNILPLLGVTLTPFQLISTWMPGGDLPEYIKKNPDVDRIGLICDVAKGLCYLHSCNVVHGDLKGLNILMDSSGNALIADFGLATVTQNLDSIRSVTCQRGHTVRWTAPELLNEGVYSKETDIFSFAMVMIEVFTGAFPFSGSSTVMAMMAIMQGRRPSRPAHPTFADNLWMLVQRCWEHDPHLRPEVSEALRILVTPDLPAWKRLISRTLATSERIPLITTIFSDSDQVNMVGRLTGDDAQAFIDTVNEVLDSLAPEVRKSCSRAIRKMCDHQGLLPRELEIHLDLDLTGDPLYRGGFADVWKGQYRDREVTVKVLRIYLTNDHRQIRRRFCREVIAWRTLRHENVLPLLGVTITRNRFAMIFDWMVRGNINEFLKAEVNPDRLGLLGDVTRGVIYMHDQGIVHGDLKGANVLINHRSQACLADFGLFPIVPDQSTLISSSMEGSSIPWMSPELLDPGNFSLSQGRPTKESDCYALGMVIYEVLSGHTPFAPSKDPMIVLKVMGGERPSRPQGEEGKLFTDSIWEVQELCWKPQPSDRPSAKVILLCLEGAPPQLWPSSDAGGDRETGTGHHSDATARDSRPHTIHGNNNVHSVPPHDHPPGVASSAIPPDGSIRPDLPRRGSSKKGRIERLTHSIQKASEVLRQALLC